MFIHKIYFVLTNGNMIRVRVGNDVFIDVKKGAIDVIQLSEPFLVISLLIWNHENEKKDDNIS